MKVISVNPVRYFLCSIACVLLTVGSADGQQPIHHLRGEPDLDGFGNRIAALGDVNDDGIPDFAVGAIAVDIDRPDSATDKVVVFSGGDGSELYTVEIPGRRFAPPNYNRDIIGLGDVTGDGAGDLAIGLPESNSEPDRGRVLIVDGRNGELIRTDTSTSVPNSFGAHLAVLSDLDGDGAKDYAVIDAGDPPVQVRSGRSGEVLFTLGASDLLRLGKIATAQDMNGDGVEDLLVVLSRFERDPLTGLLEFVDRSVVVVSGAVRGAQLISSVIPDGQLVLREIPLSANVFVEYLSAAGDVNADGSPDVIVSSFRGDHWATVFSGEDGRILHAWPAVERPIQGAASRGVGDIDGDGHDDVAVGLRARGSSVLMHAAITIHSGRTWEPLMVVGPTQPVINRYPSVFEVSKDMNHDGYPELIIGVGSTGGSADVLPPGFKGYVDVVSLKPPSVKRPSIYAIQPIDSGSPFFQRWKVQWFAIPGSSYQLEFSDDLETWFPGGLDGLVHTIGSSGQTTVDVPAGWNRGYFRVVETE